MVMEPEQMQPTKNNKGGINFGMGGGTYGKT